MIMTFSAAVSGEALSVQVAPLSIGLTAGELELAAGALAILVLLQLVIELRRHLQPSRRRPPKVTRLGDGAGHGE